MDHDLDKARNLKLLLCAFEELSGLKINFQKSGLFCFGDAAESTPEYAEIFECQLGQFPIRYLGIPIHYWRLTIAEWKHVEERLEKHLASWKAKLLSYEGAIDLDQLCPKQHGFIYVVILPPAERGSIVSRLL